MIKKSILVMAFLTLSIILAGCSTQDSELNLVESDETQEENTSDEIEETFEEEFVDEEQSQDDVEIGQLY